MSRGRKPGFVMSDDHRVKIQNSNILSCLIEHVGGSREMSATQVTAAIALLRKVLPDLSASTVEQTIHNYVVRTPEPLQSDSWRAKYELKLPVRLDS